MIRPAKGARLTGPDRDELVVEIKRRYIRHHETIRAIAEDTGRSYGFVHRALREAGVELRRRGGSRKTPEAPMPVAV